ncbi:MAG: bifunctional diguanylate cyclase/phosphodiesterase [Halioglobus sp.]|nr:bifunctional diguanylate cyclase/phosphodiesterase [Halioglobus sp.]
MNKLTSGWEISSGDSSLHSPRWNVSNVSTGKRTSMTLRGCRTVHCLSIDWSRIYVTRRANHQRIGVIYADLDRFKVVNDTHGHFAGDTVLRETAHRLRELVRESDTVARLSGDEFVFALPGLKEPAAIMKVVDAIIDVLEKPFSINGQDFLLDVSIGISMYPGDGDCAEELLKNADLAMYKAKAAPATRYLFFEETMNREIRERSKLGQDLLYAISREQLSLAYQPKVDARSHRIRSAEALVRWRHPVRGWVSPAKFIPISEETGAIQAIGEFALRQACEQFSQWRLQGLPIEQVAVNISPYQVLYSDLPALVVKVLTENGLEPHHLELEITESLLIDDYAKSEEVLSTLKSIGISLALDDFGTGYSSLAHIHQLSFDTLKIDKCFLDDLGVRPNAEAIIESILAMGLSLDKNIVAEGIDNQAQLRFLRDKGCHLYQGYYFSKPLTSDELENLLSRGQALPVAANEAPLPAPEAASGS